MTSQETEKMRSPVANTGRGLELKGFHGKCTGESEKQDTKDSRKGHSRNTNGWVHIPSECCAPVERIGE